MPLVQAHDTETQALEFTWKGTFEEETPVCVERFLRLTFVNPIFGQNFAHNKPVLYSPTATVLITSATALSVANLYCGPRSKFH